jgi:hypothetical protein
MSTGKGSALPHPTPVLDISKIIEMKPKKLTFY